MDKIVLDGVGGSMERSPEINACYVCVNCYCVDGGSKRVFEGLKERLAADASAVEVKEYVCFGACTIGPNVVAYPEGTWYTGVQESDLDDVIGHLEGGPRVDRLTQRVEPVLHELILEILDSGLAD